MGDVIRKKIAARMRLMRSRLTGSQRRELNVLIFALRLLILSFPLYLVLWLRPGMEPLQQLVVHESVLVFRAMGFGVSADGFLITVEKSGAFTFLIGEDCTGWKSMMFFGALVLATLGVSSGKRLIGLAFGLPVIHAGNMARIVAVVLVQQSFGYEAAMLAHDWLWQAGLIAVVLAAWLLWLLRIPDPGRAKAPGPDRKHI